MSANFFTKKITMRFAFIFSLLFISFCVGNAYLITQAKKNNLHTSFYFLVSQDVRIEASTELMKWEGGAGYLIENDGKQYVAYTVFTDKADGERVQRRLTLMGKETLLLPTKTQVLYFKGKKKRKAGFYTSALELLRSYIILLEECVTRLENGMTQEACKRILKVLARQFHYAKNCYGEYAEFSKLCQKSGEELILLCQNTVYLKDLRYILCWQAEKYVDLCSAFSL